MKIKNLIKKLGVGLISLSLLVGSNGFIVSADSGASPGTEAETGICIPDEEGVGGFVARLYNVALGRDYDVAGYNDWCQKLITGEMTGGRVAFGFIFSPEFVNKNLSNEEYVNTLYSVFFNRSADEAGFNNWVSQLNSGVSRESVMDGFVNSTEWANVCISFGILSGGGATASVIPDATEETINFVTRLYELCLGRSPDAAGLEHWCYVLTSQEQTAKEVAFGFIFSDEFVRIYQFLTPEERINVFYRVFLDREPDANASCWNSAALLSGYEGRRQLFMGLADSDEFRNVCASYRVICGDSLNLATTMRPEEIITNPNYVASETPTMWEMDGITIGEYQVDGYGTVYGYFVDTAELTRLVNANRVRIGLPEFTKPTRVLQEIANIRAIESAVMGVSHTRPNGQNIHESFGMSRENTTGYTDPTDAFNAYYNSPGHRSNLEAGWLNLEQGRFDELAKPLYMATATFIPCEWVPVENPEGGRWQQMEVYNESWGDHGVWTSGANVLCVWPDWAVQERHLY